MAQFRWSEITAVLGGTFDPPHLGHQEAVLGLFQNPGIRRALIIPSGVSPFKPLATSSEDRAAMTELNFKSLPGFGSEIQIDLRELDRSRLNPGPSYTIETLLELKREYPALAFVIGTDQLAQLHSWHRFPELLGVCHWIVLARKPDGERTAMTVLNHWVGSGLLGPEGALQSEWKTTSGTVLKLVGTQAPELSSSRIRETIARTIDQKSLLNSLASCISPAVLTYLMEHRIYGITPSPKDDYEHER